MATDQTWPSSRDELIALLTVEGESRPPGALDLFRCTQMLLYGAPGRP